MFWWETKVTRRKFDFCLSLFTICLWCVCLPVCLCASIHMAWGRSEDSLGGQDMASTLFGSRASFFFFIVFPCTAYARLAGPWLSGDSSLCLSSHCERCEGRHALPCWLYLCSGDSVWGPHAGTARALPTEPSLQPKKEIWNSGCCELGKSWWPLRDGEVWILHEGACGLRIIGTLSEIIEVFA